MNPNVEGKGKRKTSATGYCRRARLASGRRALGGSFGQH